VKVVKNFNGVNVIVFESVNMYENNNFKSRDVIYDGIVKKHNCGYTLVKFKNINVVNLNSEKVFKSRQFLKYKDGLKLIKSKCINVVKNGIFKNINIIESGI